MSKEDRQKEHDDILNALQQMHDSRLDIQGGYPAVISDEIRGYVVIADVDHDDAPDLEIHRWRDLIRWYRRAKRLQREYGEEEYDIAMAMWETWRQLDQ